MPPPLEPDVDDTKNNVNNEQTNDKTEEQKKMKN